MIVDETIVKPFQGIGQGVCRVVTRSRVGSGSFKISWVHSGRIERCSKSHRSGQAKRVFSSLTGRVKSILQLKGRAESVSDFAGRVESI